MKKFRLLHPIVPIHNPVLRQRGTGIFSKPNQSPPQY
jgi:hypothetical protein